MGHRKPIFVPLKTPTGSKDPRVVVIDGVPRSWTQSSFLRSFAEAYSYVEIRSVRRLHLGGWLLRLANAETAERLIGEVIRPSKHEKDAIADCLRIHRIGERTPHAIHKSEQISRQLFSTIDPQSLDCMVEIDLPEQDERMIEEGRQGEKSLDKLIEEERSTEKSLLLRAIAKKIDECLSIDESHKIIALNLRGAFLVEFESVKDADNYLEKGLPFRALGCLLKCRRNVADIRASTNFCKRCCNVGHLDITCKRAQMCRVVEKRVTLHWGQNVPKNLFIITLIHKTQVYLCILSQTLWTSCWSKVLPSNHPSKKDGTAPPTTPTTSTCHCHCNPRHQCADLNCQETISKEMGNAISNSIRNISIPTNGSKLPTARISG